MLFVICTRCQILLGRLIKEDEMGKECGMLKEEEKFTPGYGGET
jgi:hypothetical protein